MHIHLVPHELELGDRGLKLVVRELHIVKREHAADPLGSLLALEPRRELEVLLLDDVHQLEHQVVCQAVDEARKRPAQHTARAGRVCGPRGHMD